LDALGALVGALGTLLGAPGTLLGASLTPLRDLGWILAILGSILEPPGMDFAPISSNEVTDGDYKKTSSGD